MPKIDIFEQDLTQATSTLGTDIPFIPGFAVAKEGKEIPYEVPTLCTSVESFKALFGDTPYIFEDAYECHSIQVGDADRSYIMARELLKLGMPVYYYAIKPEADEGMNPINTFIKKISAYFESKDLADKDEYTIKYITTGGYANYDPADTSDALNVAKKMIAIAEDRGDAIALIEGRDTINYSSLEYDNKDSLYYQLNNDKGIQSTYAAAFIPWAKYLIGDNGITLPACYAYLSALAKTIKTGSNWLAIAGITRGSIPKIDKPHTAPGTRISNVIANSYQPLAAEPNKQIALNAITQINPYGLTIWGNRTLQEIKEGTVAGNFLNTRNMASDIKKVAYKVAKSLMYEQNNDALWIRFKSEVSPYLDQLKAGSGISDYKLIRSNVNREGKKLSREQFACSIKIFPVAAVESFEIAIVMSDADVEVQ